MALIDSRTATMARLVALLVALLVGCSAPPSSSPPAPTAAIGAAWPRAEVQQPEPLTAQPSSSTAFCSPCHPATITQMRDVVHSQSGWVAVGSLTPIAAVTWGSADATRWVDRGTFPHPEGVRLTSLATSGETIVAGGDAAGVASAWLSTDASAWTRSAFDAELRGSLNAVLAAPDGFIGAGYEGEAHGEQRSAVWTSPDARSWKRVPDAAVFAAAHVNGLASSVDGVIAVGATADGSAVSWVSADGQRWTRSPAARSLENATMLSVTVVGRALVAVGTTASGERAVAWRSDDGLSWRRSPDDAALHSVSAYAAHAEMSDVITIAGRLLAVGWNSTASNGSAVVWSSPDGVNWARQADEPGLSGGGMSAVASDDGLAVAVGSTGWPDTHAATAWRHRLR
jgi:hypothetical protein